MKRTLLFGIAALSLIAAPLPAGAADQTSEKNNLVSVNCNDMYAIGAANTKVATVNYMKATGGIDISALPVLIDQSEGTGLDVAGKMVPSHGIITNPGTIDDGSGLIGPSRLGPGRGS